MTGYTEVLCLYFLMKRFVSVVNMPCFTIVAINFVFVMKTMKVIETMFVASAHIKLIPHNVEISGALSIRWSDWLSDLYTGGYMTDKEKLVGIRQALKDIIAYPKEGGYPSEVVYDKFAYKRIVKSYRDGLKQVLRDYR